MNLILCDINPDMVAAWVVAFADHPEVEIVCGSFEAQTFDCMVSASNSLGIMGAGVDGALRRFFGDSFAQACRVTVQQLYGGRLPVGESFIIETNFEPKPYLAYTPTMPAPGTDVSGTQNAYKALSAALRAADGVPEIKTICCPGLGTAIGRLPHNEAAEQMARAYQDYRTS